MPSTEDAVLIERLEKMVKSLEEKCVVLERELGASRRFFQAAAEGMRSFAVDLELRLTNAKEDADGLRGKLAAAEKDLFAARNEVLKLGLELARRKEEVGEPPERGRLGDVTCPVCHGYGDPPSTVCHACYMPGSGAG